MLGTPGATEVPDVGQAFAVPETDFLTIFPGEAVSGITRNPLLVAQAAKACLEMRCWFARRNDRVRHTCARRQKSLASERLRSPDIQGNARVSWSSELSRIARLPRVPPIAAPRTVASGGVTAASSRLVGACHFRNFRGTKWPAAAHRCAGTRGPVRKSGIETARQAANERVHTSQTKQRPRDRSSFAGPTTLRARTAGCPPATSSESVREAASCAQAYRGRPERGLSHRSSGRACRGRLRESRSHARYRRLGSPCRQ